MDKQRHIIFVRIDNERIVQIISEGEFKALSITHYATDLVWSIAIRPNQPERAIVRFQSCKPPASAMRLMIALNGCADRWSISGMYLPPKRSRPEQFHTDFAGVKFLNLPTVIRWLRKIAVTPRADKFERLSCEWSSIFFSIETAANCKRLRIQITSIVIGDEVVIRLLCWTGNDQADATLADDIKIKPELQLWRNDAVKWRLCTFV